MAGDESLSRALTPPAPTEAGFRRSEKLHMVLVPVLLVVLLPVIVVALPFYAVALRIHEQRDLPDDLATTATSRRWRRARITLSRTRLSRPGRSSRQVSPLTTTGVLWIAGYSVRHCSTGETWRE